MTLIEFTELVETYGADSARWPDDLREAASLFMQANKADCDAILVDEARLDSLLEGARLNPGTDMLKARILSSIEAPVAQSTSTETAPARGRVFSFGHKAIAAMMLLSFSLGFAGASVLKLPGQDNITDDYVTTEWAELADDYDLGDIYDWVDSEDTGN